MALHKGNWFELAPMVLEMLQKMFRVLFLPCVFLMVSVVFSGLTGPVSAEEEPVLLTLEIVEGGSTEITTLTKSDLMAFPAISFATRTNWTTGEVTFTGVALTTVLERFDVTAGEIELIAINEYSVFLPVDDPTNEGAMLAYLMNGNPMTPRDKGPIWMVYNYDADRQYRTETVFSRSIWQLDRIIISR